MNSLRLLVAFSFVAAAPALVGAQTALRADSTVNVRTGPGTGYGIIGQVPAGHTYVGVSRSGERWKISFNGSQTG